MEEKFVMQKSQYAVNVLLTNYVKKMMLRIQFENISIYIFIYNLN